MTEAPERPAAQQADVPGASEGTDRAWYLYGIIHAPHPREEERTNVQSQTESDRDLLTIDGIPLTLVEYGDLAAVTRPVSRQEFTDESLQERLRDPAALEEMARSHNEVIARIHDERTILPAKLGSVYARIEDVQQAVEPVHDALLARLDRLEGCDEWAVHIYADRAAIEQRVGAEHPSVRQLREEVKTARPGRAYMLQRKLAAELATETDRMLDELAQEAYDQLVQSAVASQVGASSRSGVNDMSTIELLRAAFLVPRTAADAFIRVVESFAADHEGVRCEYSGPWPPYSFAAEEQL